MTSEEALTALTAMRTNPSYQDAEKLRRSLGAEAALLMAAAPENSAQRAALYLLVGTWETIATLLEDMEELDRVFEVTPVGHMFQQLLPAILHFRNTIPDYADGFEGLNAKYSEWLQKKDPKYASAAQGGLIHAMFG